MIDTIFILDRNKNVIDFLSNNGVSPDTPFFDDLFIQELDTGADTFKFSTFGNYRTDKSLYYGNYALFKYADKYKLFQMIDGSDDHDTGNRTITRYAETAGLELLTDYCESFDIEGNVVLFFNTVLQDTNWTLGRYSSSLVTNIQHIKNEKYNNVYKLIQENLAIYGGIEIEFRVEFKNNEIQGYYVDVYANGERGSKTYKRFEYGENVEGIEKTGNLYDFASAMIGVGKDKLTFKDIEWKKSKGDPTDKPAGQDFVVDIEANNKFNKHGKYIKGLFEDNDITNPQDLLLKTWEKLQEVKEPKIDYDVDLALRGEEYEEIQIGDTVYVIDNDYNPPIYLEARVGVLEICLSDYRKNKCILSNYKELKSKINDFIDITGTVNDIVDKYFPITSEGIAPGAITDGKIETKYYQQITADIVSASKVVAEELIADKASIKDLQATNAKIENLEAGNVTITGKLDAVEANIKNLTAENVTITGKLTAVEAEFGTLKADVGIIDNLVVSNTATINELKANKADITQLNAVSANIGTLTAEVGNIQTLVNGNLSSENIQAGGITSDKLTISNGFITNAMISNLDVSKVNAGDISTNKFKIKSDDGGIEIVGATQQFKDKNNRVRIQMGKDTGGNFNFILRGEDGSSTLIDHTGVKAKAIADDLIISDMISQDAVGEKQINYSSFATGFNKDTNTNTIKSTKIMLNNQNQTLDIAFNQLKTQSDDTKSVTESNSTTIGIMQGQITTAINNTQIVKDGQTILLKDDYSRTVQTVDSMKSTIGSHTTTIDQHTGKITGVETRVNVVERDLSSITARVSSTETNVTTVQNKLSDTNSNVDKLKTDINKEIKDINTSITNLDGLIGTVGEGILTDAEKAILKNELENLAKEKADIDAKYNEVYSNKLLT